jgi:hypothetical protein
MFVPWLSFSERSRSVVRVGGRETPHGFFSCSFGVPSLPEDHGYARKDNNQAFLVSGDQPRMAFRDLGGGFGRCCSSGYPLLGESMTSWVGKDAINLDKTS